MTPQPGFAWALGGWGSDNGHVVHRPQCRYARRVFRWAEASTPEQLAFSMWVTGDPLFVLNPCYFCGWDLRAALMNLVAEYPARGPLRRPDGWVPTSRPWEPS